MIERKLIQGLIISTQFIQRIYQHWNIQLIESSAAKRLASWIIIYYEQYNKAPGKDIEGIFLERARLLAPDLAEDIENILAELSDEFEEEGLNIDYLVDQTIKYFNERSLTILCDQIQANLQNGDLIEAEKLAIGYKNIQKQTGTWVDLGSPEVMEKIDQAFDISNQVLIKYPRALGEFWNDQLVRGGFVALMAPEKRGKTFWLLDLAIRAARQGRRVAFFQAGDMSEGQQLKRIGVYLTKKSNIEKYSGKMFEPVKDCIFNQMGTCKKKERECDSAVFEGRTEKELRREITIDELKEAYEENPDYSACTNCAEYEGSKWGCVWLKEVNTGAPLTSTEAKEAVGEFFAKESRNFRLSTHVNGTLTVREASSILEIWERQDNFVPDVILFDYADIMMDNDHTKEFRHKQNNIWMQLRGLSQERFALVITATQADANSYTKDLLKLENFSEDKRKYAHVTAMYGLNQDHNGREKAIGIMRINELVVREGDFNNKNQINVLQNLKRGIPFIGSYW